MSENEVCQNCPNARYAFKTGLVECTPCPSGRYGAGLIGSKTKQDSCVECPLGKYGNIESALTESAGCDQSCPGGKYGSQAGASNMDAACKSCPAGQYSNTSGITECIKCGVGKFLAQPSRPSTSISMIANKNEKIMINIENILQLFL